MSVLEQDITIEKATRMRRLLLASLSGGLLGFSFPPSEFGILATVGLIPLLIVLSEIQKMRSSLGYAYVAFLVFHLITLNWTGGYSHGNDVYMMIAGGVTMIAHPFFYFLPIAAYVFVKNHLGKSKALLSLPFIWVAYEYTHTLSEWSFPWLTIGNSQTYNLFGIQFISVTGVYGLSFWIIVLNVIAYEVYQSIVTEGSLRFVRRTWQLLGLFLVVYLIPTIHGLIVLSTDPEVGKKIQPGDPGAITLGMIQSNIDPWDKWTRSSFSDLELYLKLTRNLVDSQGTHRPDIILWPETAIPFYILTPSNSSALDYLRRQIDEIGVPVLTGFPHAIYYPDTNLAPPSAKRVKATGERYDSFNASAFIQPGVAEIPWYGKMKMVPIAERVPYANAFYYFDFLRWGVGIGGWQIGPDSVIYVEKKSGARFSSMICYESTYPRFVSSYVEKGAEFITIITIDSWWGRMSGAFQHSQFAILRAIENRRWIARCAVGGMSFYIDPFGRTYDKTELFTQASLNRTIERRHDLTFYSQYGDWLSQICLLFTVGSLATAIVTRVRNKKEGKHDT